MHSYWDKSSSAQLVIIGAGVLGLWSAIEVKRRKPSWNVVVLERYPIPRGASTRNAGFACFGSPTELWSDMHVMGEEKMIATVEMRYKGILKIKEFFENADIDLQWDGGYECINDIEQIELDKRIEVLNELLKNGLGLSGVYSNVSSRKASMHLHAFDYLVSISGEGSLHSGKYVQSLAQLAKEVGVSIFYGAHVEKWNRHTHSWKIHTNNGFEWESDQVLFATNGWLSEQIKGTEILPARGQIILTSPIERLPWKGTFHAEEGFYYWRNIDNRILLGGARNLYKQQEETNELSISQNLQETLEDFLKTKIIPDHQFDIDQRWSGIMAFSPNKTPVIAQKEEGLWYTMACNGMGVALTPIWAELVAEKITN
ncbi:MAG: FAD-binding oxidoreductase [Sediminibacterium sp.]|nr:FAD-binding oxidoreductase [Sediminibacterium sp.]